MTHEEAKAMLAKHNPLNLHLASLGEPVAIEIHGAEIRTELARMHNIIVSLPMFAPLLPEHDCSVEQS